MRFVLAIVLAGLVALPLSVSAQAGEEGATSDANLQEPALQLKLDAAGVGVALSPPRTADGYTLGEMDVRVRRAGISLGVSLIAMFGGFAMVGIAAPEKIFQCFLICEPVPGWVAPVLGVGVLLSIGGFVGTVTSSVLLRRRNRDRHRLREARYGKPRRVQWDLSQSRLVF